MIGLDDWAAVNDVLSRYIWLIDESDGEGWAALWTKDGVLTGHGPEAAQGRATLADVARSTAHYGGGMRHLYSNLICEYAGPDGDRIKAKFYSHVSLHKAFAGKAFGMALCTAELVRQDGRWMVERNHLDIRGPKGAA